MGNLSSCCGCECFSCSRVLPGLPSRTMIGRRSVEKELERPLCRAVEVHGWFTTSREPTGERRLRIACRSSDWLFKAFTAYAKPVMLWPFD
jgi:hypothetical protein